MIRSSQSPTFDTISDKIDFRGKPYRVESTSERERCEAGAGLGSSHRSRARGARTITPRDRDPNSASRMNNQPADLIKERFDDNSKRTAKSVLVIGAGVSGLTSASLFGRGGFTVTLVADRFAPLVTSVVAGALWEWPPAVCGHHHDQISLSRAKAWSATSYGIFSDLAADPTTGVYLRPATFYFKRPIAEDRRQSEKMDELRGKVRQFRHDAALIAANGISPALGVCDAYTHLAPMVDTDVYMRWLRGEAEKAGCRLIERKLTGLLRGQEESLRREYGVDAIINCTGLGAGELAGEMVYPLRGALIRVRNDGADAGGHAGALRGPRRIKRRPGVHFHRAAR